MKNAKLILTLFGIITFSLLVYWAGPSTIYNQLKELGYYILIILIPYSGVLFFDTLGWKYVLITKRKRYNLLHLLMIKLAGDFVNNVTPAGSIAGEPVKAHILKRFGVRFLDGMASVYMGKLMMAKSQIIFILMGIILAFAILVDKNQLMLIGSTIFLFFLTLFLGIIYYLGLKKGVFNVFLNFLDKIRLNFSFIEKQREQLNLFDEKISHFYKNHKKEFAVAFFSFLTSWILGSIELYVALNLLGCPISLPEAIIIESLSTIVKGVTFFIPGGIGTQEGSFILLFTLIPGIGNAKEVAMAYSIVRRIRELLWLALGMIFLSRFNFEIPKMKKISFKKKPTPDSSVQPTKILKETHSV